MNIFTRTAGFDQKDWSKSEHTFSFFGKRELVDLGSKHTSTTTKVAVYALIALSSLFFTPFIAIPLYMAYDQYLHQKGVKVVGEHNLNWIHERYFEKSDQKKEEAKIFLEKLKINGILKEHTFISKASKEAIKEIDNLFRLYNADSLEVLGEILQDQDKQVIRDLFLSNKERGLPRWAQLLMQFIAQSTATDDQEAKTTLSKAFSDFYEEFGPLSQKHSRADEAILSLFSHLLEKAPKYSAACASTLKRDENLESTYHNWQTLFQNDSFAPQALAEVAVPDISKVQEKAQELKSSHLKSHLIEKYGNYFYPYVEGKITEVDQEISLLELAKEIFPDADTNTASTIKKELFINGKFDVTEEEIVALVQASTRLEKKHVLKSAQVVAIMFCCGRPAERISKYAEAVIPKANRETHKAYMAAVSLVQNEHPLEALLTHFKIADKDLQEVSSVEKLQLMGFLRICQSKEVEAKVVESLVKENAHRRLLPLQEEKQASHLVDELIDSMITSQTVDNSELAKSDKKASREEDERNLYWALAHLLPSILSQNPQKVAKAFSLPNEQSMPQMLEDFQKSLHMQSSFREKIRTVFSGKLLSLEKIEKVLDTVKTCIPSETNSRQASNTFVDARFQEIYEKLDPENQLIFSSIMANKDQINTGNTGNLAIDFVINVGARTLIESAVKVTAELMLARNASQNQPANIYQEIAKNLHRIASYGSVSAIKMALRAYNSPYNPFRKTINSQIAKRILASLQTPFVREHFKENGEEMIEAIAKVLPSLCDKLELEELFNKLKAYDQALSSQNLGQATKALLDFSDVLTGENSAIKEIGARCLVAILNPEAAQRSKQIDELSDSDSVAETEVSWDFVSDTASEISN